MYKKKFGYFLNLIYLILEFFTVIMKENFIMKQINATNFFVCFDVYIT